MRTEYAWYVALGGTHHNIFSTKNIGDDTYDIGIVIIPKTNVEAISQYPMIQEMRRVVWPTKKETFQTVLIVFIFVLLVSIFLWMADKSFEWILYEIVLGWK